MLIYFLLGLITGYRSRAGFSVFNTWTHLLNLGKQLLLQKDKYAGLNGLVLLAILLLMESL